jgi:hypothetical protein
MPVVDPTLWDEFRDRCIEQGYDLADEVARALGTQKDYETQQPLETNEKQKFDSYLRQRIIAALDSWKESSIRENQDQTEEEPQTQITIKDYEANKICTFLLPTKVATFFRTIT